jgi:hypothetical protein
LVYVSVHVIITSSNPPRFPPIAGWLAILSDAYRRRADVTNRGFGGYTTRTLTPVAARALNVPDARFALTVIFIGTNDANTQQAQHVPLAEYEARLRGLLDAAARVSNVVLCSSAKRQAINSFVLL